MKRTVCTEPLWLLRSIPYSEYRQSNWWRKRRETYIENVRVRFGAQLCEACRGHSYGQDRIPLRFHVHHVTYERLGEERDDDLALLCSACHNAVHFPDSHAAIYWLAWHLERGRDLQPSLIGLIPLTGSTEDDGLTPIYLEFTT